MTFLPLTGPEFVVFYIGLLVAVTVAAGVLRSVLRGPSGDPGRVPLDPYQTAFLAGGFKSAAEAAIVALIARGSLSVDPGGRFVAVEPKPAWLHPVEDAVWTAASLAVSPASPLGAGASWLASRLEQKAAARGGMTPSQLASYQRVESMLRSVSQPVPGAQARALKAAARPALSQVQGSLRQRGLVMTEGQVVNVRALPALVVLAAAALGGVRLAFGMAAGRPVGYLIGLLILTGIIALLFFRRPTNPRTHRGDRLLHSLCRTNAALRTSAVAAAAGLAGADLALAVGLWGPAVLSGSPLNYLGQLLRPAGTGGSYASSSGGSCSSSSCGGGGSCGGGCGGGCGG